MKKIPLTIQEYDNTPTVFHNYFGVYIRAFDSSGNLYNITALKNDDYKYKYGVLPVVVIDRDIGAFALPTPNMYLPEYFEFYIKDSHIEASKLIGSELGAHFALINTAKNFKYYIHSNKSCNYDVLDPISQDHIGELSYMQAAKLFPRKFGENLSPFYTPKSDLEESIFLTVVTRKNLTP